jgi:hypothetical protein
MNTRVEAIAYLKSLGFYACERVLSQERVVFVGAEPVRSPSGMIAFKKGAYIRPFNDLWIMLDMEPQFRASVRQPTSLREACDDAATLLGCKFVIPVTA